MLTQFIEFNIRKDSYVNVTAKQGDIDSRYLEFHLLDGSIPFSLVGRNVRCFIEKPDKHYIFNDLEITNAESGYCILELTSQTLAVPGEAKIEIVIYSGGKKLSTIPIKMTIVKCINSDEAVESSDEFGSLETLLWKIDVFEQDLASKASIESLNAVSFNTNKRIDDINTELGTALLKTNAKTLKGGINELYDLTYIPIGEIRNFVSPPNSDWLPCDGSAVSSVDYPEYYAKLGSPPLGPNIKAGGSVTVTAWQNYEIKFLSTKDGIYAVKYYYTNSQVDITLFRSIDGLNWTMVGTGPITPNFTSGVPYTLNLFYAEKIGVCIFSSYSSGSGYNALGYLNSNDTFTWINLASSGLTSIGHGVGVINGLPVIMEQAKAKYYRLNENKTITTHTSPITFPNGLGYVNSYGDRIIGRLSNGSWIVYYNDLQSSITYTGSSSLNPYVYNYIRYYNGKYYAQMSTSSSPSPSDSYLYESIDFINWNKIPFVSSMAAYNYGYLPDVKKYFLQPWTNVFKTVHFSDSPDFIRYDTVTQNDFNYPYFKEEPEMVVKYDKILTMASGRTGVCNYLNARLINSDQFDNIKVEAPYAYVKAR